MVRRACPPVHLNFDQRALQKHRTNPRDSVQEHRQRTRIALRANTDHDIALNQSRMRLETGLAHNEMPSDSFFCSRPREIT